MTWHIIYESREGFVIQSPTGRQVMNQNEKLLHLLEEKCERQAERIRELTNVIGDWSGFIGELEARVEQLTKQRDDLEAIVEASRGAINGDN